MKKLVFASAIVSLSLFSCKKDAAKDHLANGNDSIQLADSIDALHGFPQEKDTASLTSLALSEDNFNFGNIKKGESVEHVYEVTNTGNHPLVISRVQPGCGCTAPDYTKDPILPGEKGKITLKFDSSSFDGQIHKQAEVYANVERSPFTISFTGNVKP